MSSPQINADERRYKYAELTKQIIGIFYEVYNELGAGFLEKVYEEALALVFKERGKLKACRALDSSHEAQLLHYLPSTEIEVGLLLNFGPRPQVRRFTFENERQKISVHLRKSAAT
jgi:PD-(D/E)XK nuclease superfamily protein